MWTQALNFCEVILGIHSTEKRDRVDWRDQTQPSRTVPQSSCLLEVFIRLLSERVLRTWCPLQNTRSSPPFFPLSPLHLPSHPSSQPHSTLVFSISLSKIEIGKWQVWGTRQPWEERKSPLHTLLLHSLKKLKRKGTITHSQGCLCSYASQSKTEHLRSKHN